MDYNKIYDNLMSTRLEIKSERIKLKKIGDYFEGHHIIPKCKGGLGNSSRPKNCQNIVLLTAREHFLAHWLLWRIYGDKQMALAFNRMLSISKNTIRIKNSRAYSEAREALSNANKGNKYGCGIKKVVSEEQKRKQSEIMKGRYNGEKNPFYNKKHTEETRQKISDTRKGMGKEKIWNYSGKKLLLKDGILINTFDTSQDVANFIGCSHSNVRHVLSGKQKTAKGYEIKNYNEYYVLLS